MDGCNVFSIGVVGSGLRPLTTFGIPSPDRWTYRPYSRTETAGNGMVCALGFPTVTWEWDILTQANISRFLAFFNGEDASARVRITTLIDTGRSRQNVAEFYGIMARIVDGEGKTLISNTLTRPVYSGVSIVFSRLVKVNG